MKAGGVFLLLLLTHPLAGAAADTGSVRGRICREGVEVYRGHAALWEEADGAPDPRRYVKAPAVTAPLAADGTFRLESPPGRYYLGAVLRRNAPYRPGPPQPGDVVFMSPDAAGEALLVQVRPGETADAGLQCAGWVYRGFIDEPGTGVAGRVFGADGEPVAGLLVAAFADPEFSGPAIALSGRTDSQGKFLLRMASPGRVWLRVLADYGGGRPEEGGYVGVYGGDEPVPLEIAAGEVREVGIRVQQLRFPPGRRERSPAAAERTPGYLPSVVPNRRTDF